ncbi:MAG: hypothetical protein C0446_14280 [Chitinophaga sp.]|nr:hypothetical protein [Chitinophaga sp.]
MNFKILSLIIIFLFLKSITLIAQNPEDTIGFKQQLVVDTGLALIDKIAQLPTDLLTKQYTQIDHRLSKGMLKSLQKIQKKEQLLKKKMALTDSLKANQLFNASSDKINQLKNKLKAPQDWVNQKTSGTYIAKLDSLQTLTNFLSTSSIAQKIPVAQLNKLKALKAQLSSLQNQINTAEEIKTFLVQQKQSIQQQMVQFGLGNQVRNYTKEVYYYQQQIREFKTTLNDPDKLTRRALELANKSSTFQNFMRQNSQLAQLFQMPGNGGDLNGTPIQGLQTRALIQQQISQTIQGANINPEQYIEQQVSAAGEQLNTLKDKANEIGGGSDEIEVPNFKPNTQKTKTLLKRIEWGLNVQSQRSNSFLPTTTDFGLQAGYKLSDKSTVGIGIAYKLGWGQNINNISLSSEGLGLRSFVDIKLKGSIWITGGYEMNFNSRFNSIPVLKDFNAWQRSGLLGISKKYRIGKKKGNMQLLWDFLSYSQVPQTPAIKFRLGYTL